MSGGQVKKLTASVLFFDKDKLFGNRTSKNHYVLAQGTSENFKISIVQLLWLACYTLMTTNNHKNGTNCPPTLGKE